MATIRTFEELDAWRHARQLVSDVYRHTRNPNVKNDFGYCDQIQRAAVSTMSNIAEGFGRHSDKEFAQFLNLSMASASEVRSMLYAGQDIGYLSQTDFDDLQRLCKDTIMTVSSLQSYLRRSVRKRK
jgi:four helix bundle protein